MFRIDNSGTGVVVTDGGFSTRELVCFFDGRQKRIELIADGAEALRSESMPSVAKDGCVIVGTPADELDKETISSSLGIGQLITDASRIFMPPDMANAHGVISNTRLEIIQQAYKDYSLANANLRFDYIGGKRCALVATRRIRGHSELHLSYGASRWFHCLSFEAQTPLLRLQALTLAWPEMCRTTNENIASALLRRVENGHGAENLARDFHLHQKTAVQKLNILTCWVREAAKM